MRTDLVSEVGAALAVIGAAMQFLRAQQRIKDSFVVPLGGMIALALWAVAVDWPAVNDWQAFALKSIVQVGGLVTNLFGGTFLMAKTGAAAVAMGAPADHPLVPATDSKP